MGKVQLFVCVVAVFSAAVLIPQLPAWQATESLEERLWRHRNLARHSTRTRLRRCRRPMSLRNLSIWRLVRNGNKSITRWRCCGLVRPKIRWLYSRRCSVNSPICHTRGSISESYSRKTANSRRPKRSSSRWSTRAQRADFALQPGSVVQTGQSNRRGRSAVPGSGEVQRESRSSTLPAL